jgi:hypothetical protein
MIYSYPIQTDRKRRKCHTNAPQRYHKNLFSIIAIQTIPPFLNPILPAFLPHHPKAIHPNTPLKDNNINATTNIATTFSTPYLLSSVRDTTSPDSGSNSTTTSLAPFSLLHDAE